MFVILVAGLGLIIAIAPKDCSGPGWPSWCMPMAAALGIIFSACWLIVFIAFLIAYIVGRIKAKKANQIK